MVLVGSVPSCNPACLLHKIHNRISRRGGNTWRDGESPGDGRDLERGKKGLFGFGVHKLQISNHIVPYCLSLSSSRVRRRAQSGTLSLFFSLPFPLNGALVTRTRSSTALKWKKKTPKNNRESTGSCERKEARQSKEHGMLEASN